MVFREMKLTLLTFLLIAMPWRIAAQDAVGTWQGSLQAGNAGLRTVIKIEAARSGGLKGMFYAIDQTNEGARISSITFQDRVLKFSVEPIGRYEGSLSADGNSITGSWTQGKEWTLNFQRATKETAWIIDPTPHAVQFVTVDKDVNLEVLDWGGSGRALILLAGLGNSAHVFDKFASKLTPEYHVYGITRRGFGASDAPEPEDRNYSADRLGDDVLAVMDALKISKPILVGHSIAGEELSSIGVRYPDRVAGLIYLEAANDYAYYNDRATQNNSSIDAAEVREELHRLFDVLPFTEQRGIVDHLLNTGLPRLERDLVDARKGLQSLPANISGPPNTLDARISAAINQGMRAYGGVKCPALAIYAVPHSVQPETPPADDAARKAQIEADLARTSAQADAFQAGNPSATVVRIANADHFIFESNEAEVLRAMNVFIAKLQ